MYFHLHRNSKKWTFYSVKTQSPSVIVITCINIATGKRLCVKIQEFESVLIALRGNSKMWIFLLRKNS